MITFNLYWLKFTKSCWGRKRTFLILNLKQLQLQNWPLLLINLGWFVTKSSRRDSMIRNARISRPRVRFGQILLFSIIPGTAQYELGKCVDVTIFRKSTFSVFHQKQSSASCWMNIVIYQKLSSLDIFGTYICKVFYCCLTTYYKT